MNKVESQNQLSNHIYLHRTVLIMLCLLLCSIAYYFLYALPRYNTEKLALERAKLEQSILDKEAQMNLETEKLEIQNRETQIKEDTNQRQADETKFKNKIVSEHQAEIDWCENAKAKLMARDTLTAVETQNLVIISEECNRLRKEYGL